MIVATAGHVDHGKTALVRALTGVDTDRLPQEKARGISIDLGFAYGRTPGGRTLGFVDVPGHERFVRNMLAGVCGIDAVLLVVAADDGVMPQTREHLAIVDLLGVTRGVVVITKVDAVAPERVAAVRAEVRTLVEGTGLADAPVVEVSSVTGQGIEALQALLHDAADAHRARHETHRLLRHAVDRAFTVAGSGTVVTGTIFDGSVAVGDHVLVSPSGREARVRGIQMAGKAAERAHAGERCALNLAGLERDDVARGQWIVARHAPSSRLDVRLRVLPDAPHPLRHWTPVHLHLGTADIAARVSIRRGASIAPGETAAAQLLCETPVAALNGDRFIVRDPSATRTLGGGVVIDPFPPERRVAHATRASQLDAMATLAPDRGLAGLLDATPSGVDLTRFGHAFGITDERVDALVRESKGVVVGRDPAWAFAAGAIAAIEGAIVVTLARFHEETPQAPGQDVKALRRAPAPVLPDDVFAALLRSRATALGIDVVGSIARRASHVPTANRADETLWQQVKPRLVEAGFRGCMLRDLAPDLRVREPVLADFLHRKAATGEVVRVTPQRFYPREVLAELAALATAMAAESPSATFVAAQFRDRSGVNRTLAIEILECLDRLGITQRIGDARKVRKDFVPLLGPARVPPPPDNAATSRAPAVPRPARSAHPR